MEVEVEQLDDDEWSSLEAVLASAEKKSSAATAAAAAPVEGGAPPKRARLLPRSMAGAGSGAGPQQQQAAAATDNMAPLCYAGPCTYAYQATDVDWHCQRLLASPGVAVVGCDVEWKVTYERGATPRPVALVQLCYATPAAPGRAPGYHCLLLHVSAAGMTAHLRRLLCSEAPLKVGVGLHGDGLKLQRDFGFGPRGVLDLGGEFAHARLAVGGAGVAKQSLAGLAERLLRRRLAKAQALRCSDWERVPLTAEQRQYAATDAFASLAVYEALLKMPIVWQPPALALAADGGGALRSPVEGPGSGAGDFVPAVPRPRRLQPAKAAVYQLVVGQGAAPEEVARERGIAVDSVQGYVAEAVAGGHAYRWRRLGVPQAALVDVAGAAGRLLGRELSWEAAEEEGGAATAVGGGAEEGEEGAGAVDLMQRLSDAGITIRQLKEEGLEGRVAYGHLRLALAHLGRCNPEGWESERLAKGA